MKIIVAVFGALVLFGLIYIGTLLYLTSSSDQSDKLSRATVKVCQRAWEKEKIVQKLVADSHTSTAQLAQAFVESTEAQHNCDVLMLASQR